MAAGLSILQFYYEVQNDWWRLENRKFDKQPFSLTFCDSGAQSLNEFASFLEVLIPPHIAPR